MGDDKKDDGRRKISIHTTLRDGATGMVLKSHSIEVATPKMKEVDGLLKKAIKSQKELEGTE